MKATLERSTIKTQSSLVFNNNLILFNASIQYYSSSQKQFDGAPSTAQGLTFLTARIKKVCYAQLVSPKKEREQLHPDYCK